MKIAYYALVSFEEYAPGDIIPGAAQWPYINLHVEMGKVAPVLVATLPQGMQDKLAAWEEAQGAPAREAAAKAEAEAAAKAEAEAEAQAAAEAEDETFDPGDYTVDEVVAYAEQHPDEVNAILAREVDGKNRVTLVEALTADDEES